MKLRGEGGIYYGCEQINIDNIEMMSSLYLQQQTPDPCF